MKIKSIVSVFFFSAIMVVLLSSYRPQIEGQKVGGVWEVPAEYKTKVNTYADDESLVSIGKMHYMKHCRSCHGNKGKGDGPKARNLDTFPGDFTTEAFDANTDGELFFKSIIGRDEMPNYESKLPDDEDQWALIMYIKTL